MSEKEKEQPVLSDQTKAILDFLADRFNPGIQAQIDLSRKEMEAIRFPEAPPHKVPIGIKCVHPNGYRFTAKVVPSDAFPGGRWVSIEDERWPTDAELCETIDWWHRRNRFVDPSRPDLGYTEETKLWLYDNIRLPILRAVGGALPVDWREDMQEHVKKLRAQADREVAKMTAEIAKLQAPKVPEPR